jgi:S1-C subfamily serine protease
MTNKINYTIPINKFVIAHDYLCKTLHKNCGKISKKHLIKLQIKLNQNNTHDSLSNSSVNFFIINMKKSNYDNKYIDNSKFLYEENLKYKYKIDISKKTNNTFNKLSHYCYKNNANTIYNELLSLTDYISDLKNVILLIISMNSVKELNKSIIVSQLNNIKFMLIYYKDEKNKERVILIGQEINIIPENSGIPPNILLKLKKATTQINLKLNNVYSTGSGFFYYDIKYATKDLKNGFFIASAHCIMKKINEEIMIISDAYLQNPITNEWTKIDVNKIYYDGIADVALIQTDIDFTNYPEYCLTIANEAVNEGDICYVIGNPGNFDEDSISIGYIRDANFCAPYSANPVNSIHVSAPFTGGNSGGPILNKYGNVIGICSYVHTGLQDLPLECFGAGANAEVLLKTLSILKTGQNNKKKLFLGIEWEIGSPFDMQELFYNTNFPTTGVIVTNVSKDSPFFNIIDEDVLLLSCQINNQEIEFGRTDNQRTPGILFYYDKDTEIKIKYITPDNKNNIQIANIILNKTYADVDSILDYYSYSV